MTENKYVYTTKNISHVHRMYIAPTCSIRYFCPNQNSRIEILELILLIILASHFFCSSMFPSVNQRIDLLLRKPPSPRLRRPSTPQLVLRRHPLHLNAATASTMRWRRTASPSTTSASAAFPEEPAADLRDVKTASLRGPPMAALLSLRRPPLPLRRRHPM